MNIFLTGGEGFLGSHIREELENRGHVVESYDIENNQDLLDFDYLVSSMGSRNYDMVVHCAAFVGIHNVWGNAFGVMETNVIGTYNVLQAMKINGIKKLVDFSTGEIYGDKAIDCYENKFVELGQSTRSGRWSYAVSKFAAEHFVQSFPGIETLTIRPFNVYGPGQKNDGFIMRTIKRALKNEDIIVYGNGQQVRAWLFIEDFLFAFFLLLDKNAIGIGIYNIGNPYDVISIRRLAEKIILLSNSKSKIAVVDPPGEDIWIRIPDIHRLVTRTLWSPIYNLDEGVKLTIDWYRRNE